MFRFRLDAGVVNLALHIDDQVPELVEVDGGKLSQIAINLLGNAVKFTAQGRIDVRVTVVQREARDSGAALLCIEVEDTGPGIAPSEQEL